MSAVTCEYCQAVLDPQVFSSGEKICYSCGRVIQDHGFANEASPRDAGGSAAVAQSGRHGKLTEYIRKVLGLSSQEVAELVGDDPKFNHMTTKIVERAHQLGLSVEPTKARAHFLLEQLLGKRVGATGQKMDLIICGLLFLIAKENKTALTLGDCAFKTKLPIHDIGYWYRWLLDVFKEFNLVGQQEVPHTLLEKMQPTIRGRITELIETVSPRSINDHEDHNRAFRDKVITTAEELVDFADFSGLASGRHPSGVICAAINLSFQINKTMIADKALREKFLNATKREVLAKLLQIGTDSTRQRELEIRKRLCEIAQTSNWVIITPTVDNITEMYAGIAPLIRIHNSGRQRETSQIDNALREKFKAQLEAESSSGQPQSEVPKAPVPKPTQAQLPTQRSVGLPSVLSKSKDAKSSSSVGLPTVLSKSKDATASSSGSPSSPATPKSAQPPTAADVDVDSAPPQQQASSSSSSSVSSNEVSHGEIPSHGEPRNRITAEDVVRQIFPARSFPAFDSQFKLRTRRFQKIHIAIQNLKQAGREPEAEVPFESWEKQLQAFSSELQLPVKMEPEKFPGKPKIKFTTSGSAKKRKREEEDEKKPEYDSESLLIERLLLEGTSVADIINHGENLSSLLEYTPRRQRKLASILELEENTIFSNIPEAAKEEASYVTAPDKFFSEKSAFAADLDPDFQLRPAEQRAQLEAYYNGLEADREVKKRKISIDVPEREDQETLDRLHIANQMAREERARMNLERKIRRNRGKLPGYDPSTVIITTTEEDEME